MREPLLTKARRLAVTITYADGRRVEARVTGDHDVYSVRYLRGAGYWCSCPSRRTCAHMRALAGIPDRPPLPAPQSSTGFGANDLVSHAHVDVRFRDGGRGL